MRFLVDANLPLSTAPRIRKLGHDAEDVRQLGMGQSDDATIARRAQGDGSCLVTRDGDFGDIRNYPPEHYHGILILDLPEDAVASVILNVLDRFLSRKDWLARLPGRLAIVGLGRVRFRPA